MSDRMFITTREHIITVYRMHARWHWRVHRWPQIDDCSYRRVTDQVASGESGSRWHAWWCARCAVWEDR